MLKRALRHLRDGFLSITYPQQCNICGRPVESFEDGVACSACWNNPDITELFTARLTCSKCGAPLQSGARLARSETVDPLAGVSRPSATPVCGSCGTAPFAFARQCGSYAGALEASVLFLKTNPHLCARARRILFDTFVEHIEPLSADLVVPIPLHSVRRRKKGFNHAGVIAKAVTREFGLCLDDRSLVRVKNTERHRAGMDALDRTRSVEGAFAVVRPRLIEGRAVLLIDDVFTTGSTVSSAAAALLEADAAQVSVLTLARVTPRSRAPQSASD